MDDDHLVQAFEDLLGREEHDETVRVFSKEDPEKGNGKLSDYLFSLKTAAFSQ